MPKKAISVETTLTDIIMTAAALRTSVTQFRKNNHIALADRAERRAVKLEKFVNSMERGKQYLILLSAVELEGE
jgi:hypothetical protein